MFAANNNALLHTHLFILGDPVTIQPKESKHLSLLRVGVIHEIIYSATRHRAHLAHNHYNGTHTHSMHAWRSPLHFRIAQTTRAQWSVEKKAYHP